MEKCIEKLNQSYRGCEDEIGELVFQINKMMEDKQLEWETSYSQLLDRHKDQTKNVSELQLVLQDKDAEIMDLKEEISVIDKSNYERRMILEAKISEMSQNFVMMKSQKSNWFNSDAPRKELEHTISALKEECNAYKDKIAELEVAQTTHNTQLNLLEEQRSTLLSKNEQLRQKYSRCRKEYQLKLDATAKETQILAKQNEQHNTTISELKEKMGKRDIELKNVKDTLEEVLSSNQKNNTIFCNMQKDFNSLVSEKTDLIQQLQHLETARCFLEQERDGLQNKITMIERSSESTSNDTKKEVGLLKIQLEIYQKENEFLRTFLLQRDGVSPKQTDQSEFLEKLEADNNNLKENIQNMEKEISTLIELTEKNARKAATISSPSSGPSEVSKVKERYERHLQNMKAEVEHLRLENMSLKVMYQNPNHNIMSDRESNQSSFVFGGSSHPDSHISHRENICSEPAYGYSEKTPLSPKCNSTKSDSELLKSTPQKEPMTPMKDCVLIQDFEKLQSSVLKQFEQKLNECVSHFNYGMNLGVS